MFLRLNSCLYFTIFTLSFGLIGCQDLTKETNPCLDAVFLTTVEESFKNAILFELDGDSEMAAALVEGLKVEILPTSEPIESDEGGYDCKATATIDLDNLGESEKIEQDITIITNGGFNENSDLSGVMGIQDKGLSAKIGEMISEKINN